MGTPIKSATPLLGLIAKDDFIHQRERTGAIIAENRGCEIEDPDEQQAITMVSGSERMLLKGGGGRPALARTCWATSVLEVT